MKNKPHPALLWTSYLSNEIKKDTKISWEYLFAKVTDRSKVDTKFRDMKFFTFEKCLEILPKIRVANFIPL
jgi:hypothetical protein